MYYYFHNNYFIFITHIYIKQYNHNLAKIFLIIKHETTITDMAKYYLYKRHSKMQKLSVNITMQTIRLSFEC